MARVRPRFTKQRLAAAVLLTGLCMALPVPWASSISLAAGIVICLFSDGLDRVEIVTILATAGVLAALSLPATQGHGNRGRRPQVPSSPNQ